MKIEILNKYIEKKQISIFVGNIHSYIIRLAKVYNYFHHSFITNNTCNNFYCK